MQYGLRIFTAAVVSTFIGSAAIADPIADFYKDKQINWILSAGAGGVFVKRRRTTPRESRISKVNSRAGDFR